jgi:LuxR family maltose regulon positive regulatory protein
VLDEVTAFGQHSQAPWGVSVIDAHRARLAARRGDLDTAARWAHSAHVADDAPFAQEAEAIILARVLVALNRHDEALRLAERLLASAEAGQRWGRVFELWVIQSLAFHAHGEIERAAAALEHALTLAEPHNYQRLLLDEGEAMQGLIASFRLRIKGQPQSVDRRIIEYADRLLAAFPRVATLPSPIGHPRSTTSAQRAGASIGHLVEPLSQRELEVLRCMADGLTNQEIADKLVLSLNTIKTHVKNIHSKLDVRNRTQATARARQLGLL